MNEAHQTIRAKAGFEKNYHEVYAKTYFGFIKNELEDKINANQIIQKGKQHANRSSWQEGSLHIKKLGADEFETFPAKRFMNSIFLNEVSPYRRMLLFPDFPSPLGLIYTGKIHDVISGKSESYYISQYVSGTGFIHLFDKLDEIKKQKVFSYLRKITCDLKERGVFPMDLAPRDIIITDIEKGRPTIADTENVLVCPDAHSCEEMKPYIDSQREQFRKDYSVHVKSREELDSIESLVFEE